MAVKNLKTRSVPLHDFAMNPSTDVPRSQFNLSHTKKVPFSFSYLIPILCEVAIPGDTWHCRIETAARTAVPIVPIQDNWHLEFFSFFVPMRLLWNNAKKFWGEQDNPVDSINFTIPQLTMTTGGYAIGSIFDYFGLPTIGQVAAAGNLTTNALPLRAYNKIYNDWFRDENLQNSITVPMTDGPDTPATYTLKSRGKRFDYITQALPWPQKGATAISLPIGTSAPVIGVAGNAINFLDGGGANKLIQTTNASTAIALSAASSGTGGLRLALSNTNIVADLTSATGTTLNAFRTAVAMQQYLEKDARAGTRYNEFVWGHFKVRTADARLQRPEMIGGGHAPIQTTAIPQTSATGITGGTTPAGTLAASGYITGGGAFTYACTEHGYIITLACARADITYQQGLRRMWRVSTRYDFPVPLLANLGEQALLTSELYVRGEASDDNVFGYVPRWDEYRHIPNQVFGLYRSTAAGTIDYWHSAQRLTSVPSLANTFITDDSHTVVQRNFSAGASSEGQQILADFYFDIKCARALPLYGIPGLTRL